MKNVKICNILLLEKGEILCNVKGVRKNVWKAS
nr:MAG TPA: hypothetical protein [Caudoviricetes sp.]